MGTAVVKYSLKNSSDIQWGVLRGDDIFELNEAFHHQSDIINLYFSARDTFDAIISSTAIPSDRVDFHSPISVKTQLFAQGLNYADNRSEAEFDATQKENLIFYKASSSLTGPNNDIIRPQKCQLLDYEIELGITLKKSISVETHITEQNLSEYVGGLFLCNDVSALDIMFGAPMLQFFKGKGQRTFCPAGPVLYLTEPDDFKKLDQLELVLKLNGEVKQKALTEQLIHKPAKTLSEISQFADMHTGDCLLTGTPSGVLAGKSLKVGLSILLNFTNDKKRKKKFIAAQKAASTFLTPGDILELSIKSVDGSINLGTQRNKIVDSL